MNHLFKDYKFFLFSDNPDKLVKFYTDALGWTIKSKLELDLDYGYALEVGDEGMGVWLAKHSEVQGYNKDPYRHILNMYTDHLDEVFEKARNYPGVKVVADIFNMGDVNPAENRRCATILDPEGNCLQFMENRK